MKREFDRVALLLALADRLEARFIDAIAEFARLNCRMVGYNVAIERLGTETYESTGRYGPQQKLHPIVRERNECFRQWRALSRELQLTPRSGRRAHTGRADLGADAAQHFPEN